MKFLTKTSSESQCIFTLGNGQALTFDLDRCNADIRHHLMMHGALQKVGDKVSGRSRSLDYGGAYDDMQTVIESLYDGNWNIKGGSARTTDLVTAIVNITGQTEYQVIKVLDTLDDEAIKKLAKDKDIKAEVLRIRYERAKEVADKTEDSGSTLDSMFTKD